MCAGDKESEKYWTRDGKRASLPIATPSSSSSSSSAGEGIRNDDKKKTNNNDYGDWLVGPNPLGTACKTEREVQNEAIGEPIYRALYEVLRSGG